MQEKLIPDFRCKEDLTLPESLIQDYMKNGTNLRCPRGTQSERASECIGQCQINLANKEVISVLNPITDVVYITSLDDTDLVNYEGELGSLAAKLARERGDGTDTNIPQSTDTKKRNLANIKDPKFYLNASERDYNIIGPGVQDKFYQMAIKPL